MNIENLEESDISLAKIDAALNYLSGYRPQTIEDILPRPKISSFILDFGLSSSEGRVEAEIIDALMNAFMDATKDLGLTVEDWDSTRQHITNNFLSAVNGITDYIYVSRNEQSETAYKRKDGDEGIIEVREMLSTSNNLRHLFLFFFSL